MKSLLWFFLGFIIVFAFFLNAAKADWPGECQKIFYHIDHTAMASRATTSLSYNAETGVITEVDYPWLAQDAMVDFIIAQVHYFENGHWRWKSTVYPKLLHSNSASIMASISANVIEDFDETTILAAFANCNQSCQDSDSDGLCDVCDDKPYDSTVGPTKYVRGYYELKDGTTVATIYSYSATDKTNDIVTISKKYNYPGKFPGLVYAVGMASYIDEKEFIKGGGRFAGLSKAEPVYTMKCNTVASSDLCTKAICDITDGEPKILDKLEDVVENGENQAYPTEQKAADAPYLDLDKTCDELRSKCNSSCGAATNVKSFGCSENKHMMCECLNDGSWEVADNWDDLGTTINQSETTTNNYYGDGDSTTGGGGVTGVSGDGTGGFTGSYEYVEGSYNYDSFGSHYARLATKFPFSLRTTIGSIYSDFKGNGSAPVYTYIIYGRSVTIDLSSFDDIAKMVRSFFALGITLSTIVMLIYLYVGIDLRGK